MRTERGRDIASLALLTLAVVAFFWPLVLGQAWIPNGGGDLVSFLWPMYRFAARSLRSGHVPLWNPHLHSGTPFVADNQSGVFYPVNVVTFALLGPPSYGAMEGLVVFHIWLAAVGTYVLLRAFRLRRSGAVLGALAFALSDLFITHIGNLNLNATAAWLPLLLWAFHRALTQRSGYWALATGAILGVAALAGHAQMLLFLTLALGLYALYRIACVIAAGGDGVWLRSGQTVGLTLLAVVVGLGAAALMMVPAWQMAAHTGRGHLPYDEATRYSLPPRALVGLIAPGFYGRGPAAFWGPWERVEVGYVGIVSLVLAVLGTLFSLPSVSSLFGRSRPSSEHRGRVLYRCPLGFFVVLITLAFLLALGRHTPLYRVFYRLVPTFDQIRAPARLIVLGDLGLAALAAYGLDRLVRLDSSQRDLQLWMAVGVVVTAVLLVVLGLPRARSVPPPDRVTQAAQSIVVAGALLVLSGLLVGLTRWRTWTQWLFPLLLAADLIALGSTVEIDYQDPTEGFYHPEIVSFLKEDRTHFRIDAAAAAWQPDAALIHELYDIGGVYNPLNLAPYQAYRWAFGERASSLYNLLGVKYILADRGEPPGDERLALVYTGDDIDVYFNRAALPRAFFVTDHQLVANHEEAWQAIHSPSFDPTRSVVLEREGIWTSQQNAALQEAEHIAFVHYGLNSVELSVRSPERGWLVLSDVYYPGWRATVDGNPTPVLRADYTFRAVNVPAGEHTVRMTFAPRTWYVGLVLSLISWLGLAAAAVLRLKKSWSRASDEGT